MGTPAPDSNEKAKWLRDELLSDLKRLRVLLQSSGAEEEMSQGKQQSTPHQALPLKKTNQLTRLREYYKKVFGFDPIQARIKLRGGGYKYEYFFPLKADIELDREEISIGARVEFKGIGQPVHNRIVFRRGKAESIVSCVHTALCTLDATEALVADESQLMDLARSTENEPAKLPPEEHFVSLRSYVEGIATIGIRNIIDASYYSERINPETLPFGFNSAMQRQIIKALRQIAPSATQSLVREVIIHLAQTVPEEWFDSRIILLDQIYNLRDIILTEPDVFQAVEEAVFSKNLRILAVKYPKTHPSIRDLLKKDPHYEEYQKAPDIFFSGTQSAPLFIFKIAIFGNEGSGRNSLCRRLSIHFNDPLARSLSYIGASFGFREFHFPSGEYVRLLLCNFSGEQRFDYILSDYCVGAAAAFVCYDVTNYDSFKQVPKWVELIRQKNEQAPIYLVGCKADAVRDRHIIEEESAKKLANELNCVQSFMTSARTGQNIEEMLQTIADYLYTSVRNLPLV